MKRIPFEEYFKLSADLQDTAQYAMGVNMVLTRDMRVPVLKAIEERWIPHCKNLGLTGPIYGLERLREQLTTAPQLTTVLVSIYFQDFRNRIEDGMRDCVFLQMDACDVDFYEKPLGADSPIATRFPNATFDLEEAGSCLATGRFTACVFHLSRALEVALRTLGHALGIATPNPSWDAILGKGDQMLVERAKERPEFWATNATFYAEAIKNLRAVKEAWRNPTMHVEKKYTPGHARDILTSVNILMRHLATTLQEPPA